MKQLNLILVFVVAMFVVCGRCAPALAQEASAAGTLDSQAQDVAASMKACKPTSTSARCLLTAITTLQAQVTTLQGQVTTLTSQVSSLQTTLTAVQNNHALALGRYVSVDSSAENGLKGPHIIFSGANVHIESGSGSTVDSSGLGNLVIGYNEDAGSTSIIDGNRSGSHNLVVGPQHEFTGSGSVVFGYANFTSANFASVTGGECSAAGLTAYPFVCVDSSGAADAASVTGGFKNRASAFVSSVSGGAVNTASGSGSSVSGGDGNTASGGESSVSGGGGNTASGGESSISGGFVNTASGLDSSVSGGSDNTASGEFSSILGGSDESVTTESGFFP
ncbi:MAG TPA: hypothetical protein VNZ06_11375 [Steroidobacteraceae bacterium]|nr:hypothetical protein [Steroidobacteraceae bacterium]